MEKKTILSMQNIDKSFPGVKALDNVNFDLKKGEVHALCGENGAGKSTLIKILNGVYKQDSGKIIFNGEDISIKSIADAKRIGFGLIPQEIQVVPKLSIAENIFMTNCPRKHGFFVDWKKMYRDAQELQKKLGESAIAMGVKGQVESISMGMKQLIEIMRVISLDLKILAFDEPTSSLSEEETEYLFKIIKELSSKGITVIYVSHKLKEIFQICDRVTVLKDGKCVGTVEVEETTYNDIIKMMVGRNVELFSRKTRDVEEAGGETVLEVKGLNTQLLKNINFQLKKGEILGMFGIVGSGRTETARAVFGIDEPISGEIFINGREMHINTPGKAVREGLGFVTEDRHKEGLVLISSVRNNITMPFMKTLAKLGFIKHQKEKSTALEYIKVLNVKTPSDQTFADNLSGGNQQKVVISKWLGAQSDILIFDEPTRGIDVAAKTEVYHIIQKLAEQGKSIMLISSELPEILALSDRVLVFKEGEIKADLHNTMDLKEETVIDYAVM